MVHDSHSHVWLYAVQICPSIFHCSKENLDSNLCVTIDEGALDKFLFFRITDIIYTVILKRPVILY